MIRDIKFHCDSPGDIPGLQSMASHVLDMINSGDTVFKKLASL